MHPDPTSLCISISGRVWFDVTVLHLFRRISVLFPMLYFRMQKRWNIYQNILVHKYKNFSKYVPDNKVHGANMGFPVKSPHKGQWRGALMFSLICARINGRVNNVEAGDLRRNHAHYDVAVMPRWFVYVVADPMFFAVSDQVQGD